MTQTDKIIKAVIVVVALVCMGLVTTEYWPEVAKCNKRIASAERSIPQAKKLIRSATNSGTKIILDMNIKENQASIMRYTKIRTKSIAILLFGNLVIIAVAIGLNCYLTGKKED